MDQQEKSKKQRAAYGKATALLREAYREQFDGFLAQAYAEEGLEYHPRPTAEQKAKAEMDRILAEFPHLAPDYGRPAEQPQVQGIPVEEEPPAGLAVTPLAESTAATLRGGRIRA
jgi:hypothetical protein